MHATLTKDLSWNVFHNCGKKPNRDSTVSTIQGTEASPLVIWEENSFPTYSVHAEDKDADIFMVRQDKHTTNKESAMKVDSQYSYL